jgi:hypothetical protein
MLILLRLTHVLFGVFWAGTAMFNAIFLIPAVRALGPAGGHVMQEIAAKRKLPVYFLVAGILTVLSGLALYWHDSAGFSNHEFMRSAGGVTFGIGGLFALTAVLIGIFVVTPAAMRAAKLGAAIAAGGKPTPEQAAEMQRLQVRLGMMAMLAAGLLTITTICMAVARYVS